MLGAKPPSFFGVTALLCVLAVGCNLPQTGQVKAKNTGHLLEPPAARGMPFQAFREACGTSVTHGRPPYLRAPYVQNVGQHQASVLFTDDSEAPVTVTLTRPGGELVATADTELEVTRYLTDAKQHRVTFEGLEAGQIYCYSMRFDGDVTVGPMAFRTAKAPGHPIAFMAFGDSGDGGADQAAVRSRMESYDFDLMLITGDVAYNQGTLDQYESKFFDVYDPLISYVPAFPITGNHDYGTDMGGPFREVFELPRNGGSPGMERWFSFDHGDVHFVALDTELLSAQQSAWLEEDLTANTLPWTVVYLHKPPFSSGSHGSSMRVRGELVPVFERHGVQLVLAGHDHHYERTDPQNGVTYVITGGGGAETRAVNRSSFTAHAQSVLHYVYVTVDGDTLRLHAIDGTGREFDGLELHL